VYLLRNGPCQLRNGPCQLRYGACLPRCSAGGCRCEVCRTQTGRFCCKHEPALGGARPAAREMEAGDRHVRPGDLEMDRDRAGFVRPAPRCFGPKLAWNGTVRNAPGHPATGRGRQPPGVGHSPREPCQDPSGPCSAECGPCQTRRIACWARQTVGAPGCERSAIRIARFRRRRVSSFGERMCADDTSARAAQSRPDRSLYKERHARTVSGGCGES
jgi:hypothetical protein